jgi:hypothetical protein
MSQSNEADMISRRTVYPGRQLIHLWGNACAKDLRGGSLSTVPGHGLDGAEMPGAVLKSYATPIANRLTAEIRTPGGERVFLISAKTYSKTTAKQIFWARGAIPLQSDFEVTGWEGRAETLPQRTPLVSAGLRAFVFTVPDVRPSAFGHERNHAALHAAAVAELDGLRKAVKCGSPERVGAMFATADYYRRTFTPEAAPLALPADTVAVITAFRARLAKSEARAKSEAARLHSARTAWLAAFAGTAEAIRRAYFAAINAEARAATLAEKVTAWEAGEPWPHDGDHAAEPEAVETLRRTVRALLAGRAEDCRAYVPVPAAVRAALPCPATVHLRGEYPKAKHEHGTGAPFWEACGLSAYNLSTWGRPSASREAGRDLVRLTADGSEVITSGGASVPASIARALWKRYGALMREAATAEAAPAFPGVDGAPIPFGPFNWNGWEAASPEAAASGGGAWALRVGCHRICAADLCRLANRAGWEGESK